MRCLRLLDALPILSIDALSVSMIRIQGSCWGTLVRGLSMSENCADELTALMQQTISQYHESGISEYNKALALVAKAKNPKSCNTMNQRKFQLKNPWYSHLASARQRCNNPNCISYSKYGGRGIECLLTNDEVAYLWQRDKAERMYVPSLDRKDPDGDYRIDNCRFIPQADNSARVHAGIRKRKMAKLHADLLAKRNGKSVAHNAHARGRNVKYCEPD